MPRLLGLLAKKQARPTGTARRADAGVTAESADFVRLATKTLGDQLADFADCRTQLKTLRHNFLLL
jgi:hypothetical protein